MSVLARLQLFLGTSDAYKALFKGGFVLVASAVFALGQLGPDFYTKDLEAHKLKFEAEFSIKQSIGKSTVCSNFKENEVACRLAQHHMATLDSTLRVWESYIQFVLFAGSGLMALGVLGFAMPLFGFPVASASRPNLTVQRTASPPADL